MSMDPEGWERGRDVDFDEMFRRHYEPMVRALGLGCGDFEAAGDAVQEAFIKAYARWRKIRRYESPAGWVRHVALNRLRDHFRRLERGDRAYRRFEAGRDNPVVVPSELAGQELVADLAALPRQQRIAL